MSHLDLRVLGGFEARQGSGQSVEIPIRKGQALLAYLALRNGEPVSRTKLAGLLWGDHDERHAQNSLRQTLTVLRKALDPCQNRLLSADRKSVGLDQNEVVTDAVQFDALVVGGTVEDLETAVGLYRGDLLDGLYISETGFETWLEDERRRFRDLMVRALGKLVDAKRTDGAREDAVPLAQRLLSLEPLQESVYRTMMELYAELGQRDAALQQYERCRALLDEELGVVPEAETERIAEGIRSGAVASGEIIGAAQLEPPKRLTVLDRPTIAVLPFTNMSGKSDQEYFCDGITEDIITELSRFHGLFVIARNSSFHYKGMSPKIQDVSRELGVRYVVEGSVRRSANRVRVSAQLIDAINDNHIWAERYDRELEDIFTVQDEVTQAIVSTIAGRLTGASAGWSSLKHPNSLSAYDLAQRGKAHFNRNAKAENLLARELFEKAVELDPEYAVAHVWLGWTHFFDFELGWTSDPEESAALGLSCARRAAELDSSDAWAQAGLAYSDMYARRFELAEIHIGKACKLNPNDADILAQRGLFFSYLGRSEEGIKWLEEARIRNPFALDWYLWNLGIALYTCARYESAVAAWTEMPNPATEIFASLAAGYAQLNRMNEARDCMTMYLRRAQDELAEFPGENSEAWREFWFRSYPYKYTKDLEHLLDGLRKAGLPV